VPAVEQPEGTNEGYFAELYRYAARKAYGGRWIKKEATVFRTDLGMY
jgi:hypothetical protein